MKNLTKMHFKIGSPVTGDNFFPRDNVIEELIEALDQDHVSLLAPRRTGKTSLLFRLRDISGEDQKVFFLNLEKYETPGQWITEMINCLLVDDRCHQLILFWKKRFQPVEGALHQIDSVKIPGFGLKLRKEIEKDWQRAAETFFQVLNKAPQPVIFLLDEFPILVKRVSANKGDAETMLRLFRNWRQSGESSAIKFLITGSIGLDGVVRKLGLLDTINDLNAVILHPLSENESLEFMDKLSNDNNFSLNDKLKLHILKLIGSAWPYFLQIFLSEIRSWHRQNKKPISQKVIDEIYTSRMIAGVKNKYLPHMYDRLKEILEPEELKLARQVLKQCVKHPQGLKQEDLRRIQYHVIKDPLRRSEEPIHDVLEILKHDGYLIQRSEAEGRTQFFSNMLRDYWERRFL
ncbi:MAG: hypothetical protein GY786_07770 [Proteobacteria bacterium]|nr:hypothetical protein [Pseudomonadota bacterium]